MATLSSPRQEEQEQAPRGARDADADADAAPAAAAAASPSMQQQERAPSMTLEPLSIAYYCTGHGLGHATRAIEVRGSSSGSKQAEAWVCCGTQLPCQVLRARSAAALSSLPPAALAALFNAHVRAHTHALPSPSHRGRSASTSSRAATRSPS